MEEVYYFTLISSGKQAMIHHSIRLVIWVTEAKTGSRRPTQKYREYFIFIQYKSKIEFFSTSSNIFKEVILSLGRKMKSSFSTCQRFGGIDATFIRTCWNAFVLHSPKHFNHQYTDRTIWTTF